MKKQWGRKETVCHAEGIDLIAVGKEVYLTFIEPDLIAAVPHYGLDQTNKF
jgi:hypothetical protein